VGMKRLRWALLLVPLALGAFVSANVIGRGDTPETGTRRVIHPPMPPPIPPRPGDPVDALIDDLEVGPSERYGGLTIYPLRRRHESGFAPLTFDEAVSRGDMIVREVGRGGRVNEVEVQNRSRRPVFLMAGQMLFGSKQDRIFQRDALIPPRAEWVRVPVYCVERDRWTPVSEHFVGKGRAAAPALRRAAQESASQEEIWSGVSRQRVALGVAAGATETYGAVYEDAEVQSKLREYRVQFRPIPRGGTCGVVVVGRRGIVCADIFGDGALFAKLWDSLLDSYVLDEGKHGMWPVTEEGAVREFLRGARSNRAGHHGAPTPGIGEAMRISGGTSGAALSYRRDAVHVNLYPRPTIRPLLER